MTDLIPLSLKGNSYAHSSITSAISSIESEAGAV